MTPFSITKKHMQRNVENYVLYFATIIFSIAIYFAFVSLQYNEQIANEEYIRSIFSRASHSLMIFVAIFIWYSNSFFIKKRKKEIALYSLLGLTKRKIGAMLFSENFILGIFALVIGMGIGIVLSKLFAMLVLKLMELPTAIPFSISIDAVFNTICVFTIILFITSLQGYMIINKFKLFELIREKKGEHITKSSIIMAIEGICIFVFSIWFIEPAMSPIGINDSLYNQNMNILLGSFIIGTYFVSSSCTVFVLLSLQKYKKFYCRGINMVGVAQILSNIQSNAKVLTVIVVLSVIKIHEIGGSYAHYYIYKTTIDKREPFSFMYVTTKVSIDQRIEKTIKNSKHTVEDKISIPLIRVNANLNVDGSWPLIFERNQRNLDVLAESTFHKLANITKTDIELSLKNTEAIILDPNTSNVHKTEYKNVELQLPNQNYTLQFVGKIQDNLLNKSLDKLIIVVSDKAFSDIAKQQDPYTIQAYKVSNDKNMKELAKAIEQIVPEKEKLTIKYTVYRMFIQFYGLWTFVDMFLGLVFLAATGSVLYFNQLTEAIMSKNQYIILRELGVSKQMIFRSIAKQVAVIFIIPFCIGTLYSITLLKTYFNDIGGIDVFVPVSITIGAYTLIYFVYYLLTVRSYNRIVNR